MPYVRQWRHQRARSAIGSWKGKIMGLISSVSLNPAGRNENLFGAANLAGAAQAGATSQTTAASVLTGSQSITNVFAAVSTMMQSIGGGVENDRLMRMLIALMIILSLLQEQQEAQSQSGGNELAQLGNGAKSSSSYIGIFSSSTTIIFQQTTTEVSLSSYEQYAAGEQVLTTPGSQVDLSA